MRRAVVVLLACSAVLLWNRNDGAATAQVVTGAPTVEAVIRGVLAELPPADVARIVAVRVVPVAALHHGAIPYVCGEAWVTTGVILIADTPRCLARLPDVLVHELGHFSDPCRALALAWAPYAEQERCAEQYRERRRPAWIVNT